MMLKYLAKLAKINHCSHLAGRSAWRNTACLQKLPYRLPQREAQSCLWKVISNSAVFRTRGNVRGFQHGGEVAHRVAISLIWMNVTRAWIHKWNNIFGWSIPLNPSGIMSLQDSSLWHNLLSVTPAFGGWICLNSVVAVWRNFCVC